MSDIQDSFSYPAELYKEFRHIPVERIAEIFSLLTEMIWVSTFSDIALLCNIIQWFLTSQAIKITRIQFVKHCEDRMVLIVQRIFKRDLHKHSCLLVSPLLCTFLITTMSTFSNMLNRGQEYRKNTTVLCENHQQRVFFFFIKATFFLSNIKKIGLSSVIKGCESIFTVLLPIHTLAFSSWVNFSSWTSYPMDGNQKCSALHNIS